MKSKTLMLLGALMLVCGTASGQKASIKTNALYLGTTTPNLAIEFGLGPRTTIEIAGGYNNWSLGENTIMAHWLVQPEVRHWFCERFAGTFIGFHLHGGEYNLNGIPPFTSIKENRHDGYFIGAGVSVGHQWLLSRRLALEAELGVGYAYVDYLRFGRNQCDAQTAAGSINYFGPTRLNVSLVYYLW